MGNAAWIQQDGIRYGKDSYVGSDAECQREYGNDGEAGRVGKLANRVTKLMSDGMHFDLLPRMPTPTGVPA
jgi:hypothetical protein